MNRRIDLVKHTILKRRLGGSPRAWLLNTLGPTCDVLAKRVIDEVASADGYTKIRLRGHNDCMYLADAIPIRFMYQTLAEQGYSWNWHYYQIPQTAVEPDDIVIDCGSAEGTFSYLAYETARHIYAFEPLPDYARGLRMTFRETANVTVVESALGDVRGTGYLVDSGISSSITTELTDTEVAIDTVDDFCRENGVAVSYIKADLEGYELKMLHGARETIENNRPKIAVTTYHDQSHAREIAQYLLAIIPSYNILTKGIEERRGEPVMLHAW